MGRGFLISAYDIPKKQLEVFRVAIKELVLSYCNKETGDSKENNIAMLW